MNGKTNVTTTSNGSGTNVPHIPPNNFIVAPGDAKTQITWTDPNDLYASPEGVISQAPYQLVSKWTSTKIVRSETDYPATPNDGILAVESNIRDEHKTTVFEDTNLNNGTVYYYSAFGMNEQGLYSQPSTQYAEVRAALPTPDSYFDTNRSLDGGNSVNVMSTTNYAIEFGAEYSASSHTNTTIVAYTIDGTMNVIGPIAGISGALERNSVASLNGYGFSVGGTDSARTPGGYFYWYTMAPEIVLQMMGNDPPVTYTGLTNTQNYVIRAGGTGSSQGYGNYADDIRAYTTEGTVQDIETLIHANNHNTYAGNLKQYAIFVYNTSTNFDTAYTDDLTKIQLSSNTAVYGLTWANTPNHLIFHPGNTNGYSYDTSLTRSNVSQFTFSRKYPQGFTIGNYAAFIGGTGNPQSGDTNGIKYDQLYQLIYYDLELTMTNGDQIDNPLDANPGTPQSGPFSIRCGDVYTTAASFGDTSMVNSIRNLYNRYYKFKLA